MVAEEHCIAANRRVAFEGMAAGVSPDVIGVDEVRIVSLAGERGFLVDVLLKFLNFR
jgi:hypothetical protein